MGRENRDPTLGGARQDEGARLEGDGDGAVGFSTGLQYVPGTYSKTPEIVELARVAANEGGLYASHMRNEGTALEAAIQETLRVGEATGARVQVSHLKVDSPSRWGASAKALAMIDAARGRGIDRHRRSVRLHGGELEPGHPVPRHGRSKGDSRRSSSGSTIRRRGRASRKR